MSTAQVTEVSPHSGRGRSAGLRGGRLPGEDAPVFRTLLEPLWPGRRADAYDQFCR